MTDEINRRSFLQFGAAGAAALALPIAAQGAVRKSPYHAGVSYYPGEINGVKFDYSEAAIRDKIRVGTVRKFGGIWWDRRWYSVEGERVEAFRSAGKRVIGTWTVGDNAQWSSLPNADWRSMTQQYARDLPTRGIEVGNEPGKFQADAYLEKLRIAADIFHNADRKVYMAAPYPGAERAVWEAAANAGAFNWVDGVCSHPYAASATGTISKVGHQRGVLRDLGCDKPLHLTEFGWYSTNGENLQAAYITQAFQELARNADRWDIGNALYYILQDWTWGDKLDTRGVIAANGRRKPAFDALAKF